VNLVNPVELAGPTADRMAIGIKAAIAIVENEVTSASFLDICAPVAKCEGLVTR
jgi:hypothetical protein